MISVIMSTYNEKSDYISCSIESILNQTEKEFEFIIVIDNPENRAAVETVRFYAEKDSRIKLLFNPTNLGLVTSLNRALDLADGEYIARMDADDIALPNRLENELKYLTETKCDIVGCRTEYIDEFGNSLGRQSLIVPENKTVSALKVSSFLCHPSWLARIEVYNTLNGYRNIDSCEDYDFLVRAVNSNYRIAMTPEVLLNYRMNSSGISQTNSFKQFLAFYYISKHFDHFTSVSENDIIEYVKRNSTDENAKRFVEGYGAFLKLKSASSFSERTEAFFKAVFSSRFYSMKLLYALRSTMI